MGITYNGTEIEKVIYNGTELDKVIYNGVTVFEKKTITDLTGTSWLLNDNIIIGDLLPSSPNIPTTGYTKDSFSYFYITFTAGNSSVINNEIDVHWARLNNYYGTTNTTLYFSYEYGSGIYKISNSDYTYNFNAQTVLPYNLTTTAQKTIHITGGSDATNATLIAWFQANATQIS